MKRELCRKPTLCGMERERVAPQLLTTSNFIGPWYHAALLFSGLGSIVLLFGVLFSQQIREDLVRAATSPKGKGEEELWRGREEDARP